MTSTPPDTPHKPVPYSGPDLSDDQPQFNPRLLFVAWGLTIVLSIEFMVPHAVDVVYALAVTAVTSNTAAAESAPAEPTPQETIPTKLLTDR